MFSRNAAEKVVGFLAGALMVAGVAPAQTVYYVDDDGASTACTGWSDACPDLQTALGLAVSGDQIWVAAGTYKPTSGTDRMATFQLITGVEVYGGFDGTEGTLEERAGLFDETILSGDIGTTVDDSDNSYHVVTGSGTDATAVLDGFTITGGNANGSSPHYRGGGMDNESGSPTVTNCTFSGNLAFYGGGMYNYDSSSPTLTNCAFSGNTADRGGGMYNSNYSSPAVTNCTFTENSADSSGGMYNYLSSPTVTNCTFSGNSAATYAGGGMTNGSDSSPTVNNCTFTGNSAGYHGGGMCNYSSAKVTNCIVWGNTPEDIFEEGSGMTVKYSVVGDDDPDDDVVWPGTGNIDDDPLLTCHGFHLTAGSPCRDRGDPGGDYTGQTDVDGEPRVVGPEVDMGADEWLDTDGDGLPNFWEELHFGSPTGGDALADEDGDLVVNLDEYRLGRNPHIASVQLFVDVSGDDTWDGLAAESDDVHGPKATIQAAIDAAAPYQGDRVSVAPGTYNEAIDFLGKAITLRSSDGPEITVIDATGLDASVVTCANGEDADTVLEGFTITGGTGTNGGSDCRGGGMYNCASSPTVSDCIFSGNSATLDGGGMLNLNGSRATVDNCTFSENSAKRGGGMSNSWSSRPTVTSCTFSGNSADENEGGGMYNYMSSPRVTSCTFSGNWAFYGGGMYNYYESSPTVTNCTFTRYTGGYGSGMYNKDHSSPTVTNCTFRGNAGAGMCNYVSSPTVTDCTFSRNSASAGGGMFNYNKSSPAVANCTFMGNRAWSSFGGGMYNTEHSSPTVTNCTFSGNTAAIGGGGMSNSEDSNPTVSNCTFTANFGLYGGGGMSNGDECDPTVTNCTFTRNSAFLSGGGMSNGNHSNPTIANSILWGNTPEDLSGGGTGMRVKYSVVGDDDPDDGVVYPGTGNLDDDPLLTRDGVHLTAGSPCRDSGDPGGHYPGQTDVDGEPRVIGAGVDIGADEWLDTDGDGLPDFWEELHFGSPTAGDALADDDGDLVVNLDEYRLGRNPHRAPVVLFVDVAGDDAWDGLAAEWDDDHGPKATIQAAIDAAGQYEGDEISVAPGTYPETINFLGKAVALRSSAGSEFTVIDAAGLGASVVTCASGEDADTVLEGFTITDTGTGHVPDSCGGGMYNPGSSPTVANCTFTGNSADGGGGMCNIAGSPTVNSCTFRGNLAYHDGGGGMSNMGGSPTVNNCMFHGNSAYRNGGGGMHNWRSSPTVNNCTFHGNSGGGAMHNFESSSPRVTNCTFTGNLGRAMYNYERSSPTTTNCVLWRNPPDEIYNDGTGTATVTYSVVMDNDPDDGVVWPGTGNLDDDPLLTRPGVHLTAGSPCRDSGDPGGDYTGQADVDGEPRVIGPRVDMGADEWLDADGDALPDFWEELHFGSPTAGDPLADDDGDLVVNLDEYRLGRAPHRVPAQLFVDVSGDDAWDGLAPESDGVHGPKATIQAAIEAAARYEGDEISVAPGTYNEVIDFVGKAVALRSRDGPEATVIDATGLHASVATCANGEGPDTILDGFTITGGTGRYGGGMDNVCSNPTVTNCTFSDNRAWDDGGGMYNRSASPTVTNCTFNGNSADYGGGMYNRENSSPAVANCTFTCNSADSGGGLYNRENSSPAVANCTFNGNSADYGGGMYNRENSSPAVANCTFTCNWAGTGSGMCNSHNSSPTATNCILWGNASDEIYDSSTSTTTVTYSVVMDDDPDDGVAYPGTGNLDDDPRFVREPDDGGDGWGDDPETPEIDEGGNDDYGDLRLSPASPCIDAADNTAVPADTMDLDDDDDLDEPIPLDLAGHPRFVDDLATEDTGNPSAEVPDRIVDMGAYEAATAGDCNWDERVDLLEYYVFHACLTGPDPQVAPYCWMLDLDGSGEVNLADFAVFERQFTGSP